jgi:hypothetical protein
MVVNCRQTMVLRWTNVGNMQRPAMVNPAIGAGFTVLHHAFSFVVEITTWLTLALNVRFEKGTISRGALALKS